MIPIPFDPDEAWGTKERHYVAGTVNGYKIRSRLESMEEGFCMALGPSWRRDRNIDEGLTVEVVISPEGPQMGNVSPDIAAAFEAAPDAHMFFESIPTFYRKNFIRWIEGAKRPETRKARIERMIDALNARQRSI